MNEHHIDVVRTARYVTLGRPADARQLWIVCHGYRQLARRFLRRFLELDDGTRVIVAPEGLSRFYLDDAGGQHGAAHPVGASWMTREDRLCEIDDYLRYLDAVLDEVRRGTGRGPVPELIVLGFSQGVHTACRWVVARDMAVRSLVCWGAYPPDDLDPVRGASRLTEAHVVLVRGSADEHASASTHQRQEDRLGGLGIPFRTLTHPGGHDLDLEVLRDIAG